MGVTKEMNNIMVNNPKKAFKKMAPPLVAFCIFDAFYSMIDLMWAGFIGGSAIAAVGICTPLFLLITNFGRTLGMGTNSLMSRFLGSKHNVLGYEKQASNILVHGVLLCIIVSILILIVGVTSLESLLTIMNLQISTDVVNYAKPLFLFSIIFIFVQFFPETLQAEGETRIPTTFLIVGNVLNLILDPILGIYCGWGVIGLSLATLISSILPFSVFFYLYVIKKNYTPIKFSNFKFNTKILKEILVVAIPNYIDRSFSQSILRIYINSILSFIGGALAIAIYSVSIQLSELLSSPSRGTARATLSILGHLIGANKIDDFKSFYFYTLKIGLLISFIMIIPLCFVDLKIINPIFQSMDKFNWIIVIGLMVVVLIKPLWYCSCKIFDSLGLSFYNLLLQFLKLILDIIFVSILISPLREIGVIIALILGDSIKNIISLIIVLFIFKRGCSTNSIFKEVAQKLFKL